MMLSFHHTGIVYLLRFSMKIFQIQLLKHESGAPEAGSSCLSADTERALQVMEACQAGAAEGVKGHAEKLLNIFQSDLFQALLGKVFLHNTNMLPQQRNTTIRCSCSVHSFLSVLRFYHTNQSLLNWTVF